MGVQEIMRLKRRQVLVQLPEDSKLQKLRTLTVPKPRVNRMHVEQIKDALAQQSGRNRNELVEAPE